MRNAAQIAGNDVPLLPGEPAELVAGQASRFDSLDVGMSTQLRCDRTRFQPGLLDQRARAAPSASSRQYSIRNR